MDHRYFTVACMKLMEAFVSDWVIMAYVSLAGSQTQAFALQAEGPWELLAVHFAAGETWGKSQRYLKIQDLPTDNINMV